MASIVDAFNEALTEDLAYVKIIAFSIPVNYVINLYMVGKTSQFELFGTIVGVLLLGLLSQGINNVRMNRREILTLNPLSYIKALGKTLLVLVPQVFVFGLIGKNLIDKVQIPIDLPHVPLIFAIIVWSIIFSIVLTSYMSFAKYLKVAQGYNFKVILESCIDVLISFLFFIPQLLLANIVLIGPVAYLFSFFNLPFTHFLFITYCSMVFIVNISILANYLAQAAYEHIRGNNEEYDENVNVNLIDDVSERVNGN